MDGSTSSAPDNYMMVTVNVDVRVVARQGRNFQWPTECQCPKCGNKTWAHGKVPRIFDGIAGLVLIPRRRCPRCKCVITLRPSTHKPRIQTAIRKIISVLEYRLIYRVWPNPNLRQRCGHWLQKLSRWCRWKHETDTFLDVLRKDEKGKFLAIPARQ